MRKITFHTLGCKVNQVETEQWKEDFVNRGYQIVEFDQPADIYVVNTCAVTHVSERKSRQMLRRAAKDNPHALIVAAGCMAQIKTEELAELQGIGLIIGNRDKDNLAEIVDNSLSGINPAPKILVNTITASDKPPLVVYKSLHQRRRAFVKIQDGCDGGCTFCVVPGSRGPARSKLAKYVIAEVGQLINLGYKEIVLTGIHTGMYGIETGQSDLHQLLASIFAHVPGEYRLRLSSLEPTEITDDLLTLMKNDNRLCPHLHIPLQSGSNKILQLMGRNYDVSFYRRLILKIADLVPEIAIVADVIVGFPGENEEDFQSSRDQLENLPLMDLHVFKYSPRPQTLAANFPGQVPEKDKQERSKYLLELARQKNSSFKQQAVGKNMRILVEKKIGDYNSGFSDNYIPVRFKTTGDLSGELVQVQIEQSDSDYCLGILSDIY